MVLYKKEVTGLFLMALVALFALLFTNGIYYNFDLEYYNSATKLIYNGGVFYRDLGDIKGPLNFYLLALFMLPFKVFPYLGLRLICFLLIFGNACLIFLLFRKIEQKENKNTLHFFKSPAFCIGVIYLFQTGCHFYLYANYVSLLGNFLLLISFLFFFSYFFIENLSVKKKYFSLLFTGFFYSLSILSTQVTVVYIFIFPLFYFALKKEKSFLDFLKYGIPIFLGFILPLLGFFIYFWVHNALFDVYYWLYLVPFKSVYLNIDDYLYNKILYFTHSALLGKIIFFLGAPIAALPTVTLIGITSYFAFFKKVFHKKSYTPTFIFIFTLALFSLIVRFILLRKIYIMRYTEYLMPFYMGGLYYFFNHYFFKLKTTIRIILITLFTLAFLIISILSFRYQYTFIKNFHITHHLYNPTNTKEINPYLGNKNAYCDNLKDVLKAHIKNGDSIYLYAYNIDRTYCRYSQLAEYKMINRPYSIYFSGFCPAGTLDCSTQSYVPNKYTYREWNLMVEGILQNPPKAIVDYWRILYSLDSLEKIEKIQKNAIYISGKEEARVKKELFFRLSTFIHKNYTKYDSDLADVFILNTKGEHFAKN